MRNMLVVYAVLVAAAAWAQEKAAEPFTQEQIDSRFYYDLGPKEIDVSGYPKDKQASYLVFKKTCSQCHTLARPINAPVASAKDWQRYILRMYERTKSRPGKVITKDDEKAVLDFLTYDSNVRKLRHKKDFDFQTARLKAMFEDVKAERTRRQAKADQTKVKQNSPYTGTK